MLAYVMWLMFKQSLVVRRDLGMSWGKIVVQAAHASVSALEEARQRKPEWARRWIEEGQKKIALKVSSYDELLELARKCDELEIPYSIIQDAGLTELPPGTVTAIGIGPAPEELIDKVTGNLPLL